MMVSRLFLLIVLANVHSKSLARTPIDTSKIIYSQYWQILDEKWFGDDTIVLKSITKRQLDRKPTKGRHQKYFDYFYFDSSHQIIYNWFIPGSCPVGYPIRWIKELKRNGNQLTVTFYTHHHTKSNYNFTTIEGTILYEISEFLDHSMMLVKLPN
jgi:hypothetical protein